MATIHIDPDSPTNGAGTLADPRNTATGMTWTAGNAYLFKRGTAFAEHVSPNTAGTAGSRILIGAYGDAAAPRPIIQGQGTAGGAANDHGLHIFNRGYFDLRSLHVKAAPGTTSGRAINSLMTDATTAQHHTVEDCLATDAHIGLHFRGVGSVIRHSQFHTIRDDCMYLQCTDTLVEWCEGWDFALQPNGEGDFVHWAGSHNAGKCTVRRSKARGQTINSEKQHVMINPTVGEFRIEDCEFYGLRVGVNTECAGTIIRRVKFREQMVRAVGMSANGVILESLDIADTEDGVQLAQTYTGGVVENCTIRVRGVGVVVGGGGAAGVIRYNVIDAAIGVQSASTSGDFDSDNNAYAPRCKFVHIATEYADLAAWQAARSQDAASTQSDLRLTANGRPLPGSPCLTGGAATYSRDADRKQSRGHRGCFGAARLEAAFPG